MLAIATTCGLHILDTPTLKQCPDSVERLERLENPVAGAWASDNASIFVATRLCIARFDPLGHILEEDLPTDRPAGPISCVAAGKDGGLFYAQRKQVLLLDAKGHSKEAFQTHSSDITSITLNSEAGLLASTSATAVHVHNLSLSSHTVLRGLSTAGSITTSVFHPHSRTRLLLAIGTQLVVYDTTRPSGPIKVVQLNEATPIVGVACSPFSKTLVAIASSGGTVGLVDLDKEKALFRTLNLKTPLTSVTFSYEGAAIYAGTEDGRFLIMDLRALDKPPKEIHVGSRVSCMFVQKKLKPSAEPSSKTTTTASEPARRPSAQGAKPPPPARVAARTSAANASPRKASVAKATARVAKPSIVSSPSRPTTRPGARPAAKLASKQFTSQAKETKVLSSLPLNEPETVELDEPKEDLNFSMNVESLAPMRAARGLSARIGSSRVLLKPRDE